MYDLVAIVVVVVYNNTNKILSGPIDDQDDNNYDNFVWKCLRF